MSKDYERGVEQASAIYKEVIREYVAENAKLREQNRYLMKGDLLHVLTDQEYIDQCERERLMQVSIDALDKENAKLRELVRILKNCADECGDCDTCPINGEPGVLNPWLGCDSLRDLMRELGVEVDG